MTDVVIRCEVCDGSGILPQAGIHDTFDWDWEECSNCAGSGLELIEAEFTEDEVAA